MNTAVTDLVPTDWESLSNEALLALHLAVNEELNKRFPMTLLNTTANPPDEELTVIVGFMRPIEKDANPFLHDSISSGQPISKQWTLMHANGGKHGMYLYNSLNGQRITLRFVPKDITKIVKL